MFEFSLNPSFCSGFSWTLSLSLSLCSSYSHCTSSPDKCRHTQCFCLHIYHSRSSCLAITYYANLRPTHTMEEAVGKRSGCVVCWQHHYSEVRQRVRRPKSPPTPPPKLFGPDRPLLFLPQCCCHITVGIKSQIQVSQTEVRLFTPLNLFSSKIPDSTEPSEQEQDTNTICETWHIQASISLMVVCGP